jgi:hypothetical protein
MERGVCKMCLLDKDLVSSHLMPAGVYKYCRAGGVSPIRVGNGVVRATDLETQYHLLCAECERILDMGGENWVIPKLATASRDSFPLYELLAKGAAAHLGIDGGIYRAADNPEIDVQKLTHFALGIFWKSSVHSWKAGESKPKIDLGIYSEMIRTWLRGEKALPTDMSFHITISKPENAQIIMVDPSEQVPQGWRSFWMHVPGVRFSLNVGTAVPIERRTVCFWNNPAHLVLVSDKVTGIMQKRFVEQFSESRKTRSYLAARSKRSQPDSNKASTSK